MKKRIKDLEKKLLPQNAHSPVVIVEKGQPVSEGAQVVLIDDIPREPIRINKIN